MHQRCDAKLTFSTADLGAGPSSFVDFTRGKFVVHQCAGDTGSSERKPKGSRGDEREKRERPDIGLGLRKPGFARPRKYRHH